MKAFLRNPKVLVATLVAVFAIPAGVFIWALVAQRWGWAISALVTELVFSIVFVFWVIRADFKSQFNRYGG